MYNNYTIIDIETDGLLDKVTKIHCLSYKYFDDKNSTIQTITDYEEIKRFILFQEVLVGHNIVQYDIPTIEKILDIKINCVLIDTLAVSHYLYPIKGFKHGLGAWGEKLGFGKPFIEDWKNQDLSVYINRCQSDVEINTRLFDFQINYLNNLYDTNFNTINSLFRYLTFKVSCLKEQNDNRIDLDLEVINTSILDLNNIINLKIDVLSNNMPKKLGKILFLKPKNTLNKQGFLSAHGVKWLEKLTKYNLDKNATEIREKPNPGSPLQLKKWLLDLGWKPETFKISKNTGENIPQVSLPFGAGICKSVKNMFEIYPYLKDLEGLYKAQHRLGLFKSFLLNKNTDNKVSATAQGFTNTLRMQHSKPVNFYCGFKTT